MMSNSEPYHQTSLINMFNVIQEMVKKSVHIFIIEKIINQFH